MADFLSFEPFTQCVLPFKRLRILKVSRWGTDSQTEDWREDRDEVTSLEDANLISSKWRASDQHMVVLDIDVPAALIPSSTPGHSHLYIKSAISWETYARLLDAMADAGILERGYVAASKKRGFTGVRVPWVTK